MRVTVRVFLQEPTIASYFRQIRTTPCYVSCSLYSQTGKSCVGVTEVIKLNTHAVHEGEVHATELAVIVALLSVVQDTARFQRAPQAANQQHGYFAGVVLAP